MPVAMPLGSESIDARCPTFASPLPPGRLLWPMSHGCRRALPSASLAPVTTPEIERPATGRASVLARWGPAVVWLTFPLTVAPAISDGLAGRSHAVQLVVEAGAWILWTLALAASLHASTASLTALRTIVPASVVAAAWAALASGDGSATTQSVALGMSALATVLVLSPQVGHAFINGSSYGDETRWPLRAPAAVLFGPLELVWAAMVASIAAGPLLLATRQWIAGAIVSAVGAVVLVAGARILHQLGRRWFVFVPAGCVVVDRTTLADSLLVQRRDLMSIGPARDDDDAADLTAGAAGLALRVELREPDLIIPMPARRDRHRTIVPVEVGAVRFTPTRPGAVLAEARARRVRVVSE